MEGLRIVTAAAAVMGAGALAIGLFPVSPGLPDIEVRNVDLAASLAGQGDPELAEFQNRIQDALDGGAGGVREDLGLGTEQADVPEVASFDVSDPNLSISDSDVQDVLADQNLAESLLGTGFDANALGQSLPEFTDAAAGDIGAGFTGIGAADPGAGSAATAAAAAYSGVLVGAADVVPMFEDAYGLLTTAVANAELDFNSSIVEAQESAAAELFGEDTVGSNIANWMFTMGNRSIAEAEAAFNHMLGVSLNADDLHSSLTTSFNLEGLQSMAAEIGLGPEHFDQVLEAIQDGGIEDLLHGVDWDGIFDSLF